MGDHDARVPGAFVVSLAATWGRDGLGHAAGGLALEDKGKSDGGRNLLQWLANFVVSQTFPSLSAFIGPEIAFHGHIVIGVPAFFFVNPS